MSAYKGVTNHLRNSVERMSVVLDIFFKMASRFYINSLLHYRGFVGHFCTTIFNVY